MSRPQDSIIDDDEESCPLCIEEFDLTDKNFKPCPCGYQICQFCFNSLKNTYERSTCPNCRRIYDEKTIQFKIPSKEDIVNDKENKARKQAATKRKEVEKREVETSNRRNLAGVRVKQQNLVYVIGLVPAVKDESTLLQTLRGVQYFGQYGDIDKIVVSKSKPGATSQGIGVYITYATKAAAALCIEMVDGSMNGDRVLRAQYGTTKYCSAYLRGENCNNKSCTFLHETGEDGHNSSLQNEPSHSKAPLRPTNAQSTLRSVQPASQPTTSVSQPMQRESSKDETKDRVNPVDTSALPSTASWANRDTSSHIIKHRRPSQAGGRSSTSPQVTNAVPPTRKLDEALHREHTASPEIAESSGSSVASKPQPPAEERPSRSSSSGRPSPRPPVPENALLDKLVTSVSSPGFRFSFDEKAFSDDELAAIERCPTLIDPYGGAKRRFMREEAERIRQQNEAHAKFQGRTLSAEPVVEEDNVESGSLALGGEPEEGARDLSAGSAIRRPNQNSNANSSVDDQNPHLGIDPRGLTAQQRQQLALSSGNLPHAPGLGPPNQQGFSLGGFDDQRLGSLQAPQHDPLHSHGRQSSRYSFANDSVKPSSAPRFPTAQQSGSGPQHFYSSGVQGPPPGLKTAGTPPISGGGMFAQGHGFTSHMSTGFGVTKDASVDMLMRGRSGTGPGQDISKREYLLSLEHTSYRSPPSVPAPAPGLLHSLYGPYSGAYQDPGLVKQKKKGKKHRHANTSSSGGGVVDLADPSIFQARLHPNTGGAGQGPFGGQIQDDQDFPALVPPSKLRDAVPTSRSRIHSVQSSLDSPIRSQTPRVPPGLSLPHAHPSPSLSEIGEAQKKETKVLSNAPSVVTPALPILPVVQRAGSPKARAKAKEVAQLLEPVKDDGEGYSCKSTSNGDEDKEQAEAATVAAAGDAPDGMEVRRDLTNQQSGMDGKDKGSAGREGLSKPDEPEKTDGKPLLVGKDVAPPGKLDISAAVAPKPKSNTTLSQTIPPVLPRDVVATPPPIESVPGTPIAGSTKPPDWASNGRPRTLRLTTTTAPKAEGGPASAITDRSGILSAAVLRQSSRQPSLSSVSPSHPSTPTISEHGTSTGISRAGSPPALDIIGSAPARKKTKSQAKKERKTNSKTTTEAKDDDSAMATPVASEEVGPIISRQKKKKRTQDKNSQALSDTKAARSSEPASPAASQAEKTAKVELSNTAKEAASIAGREPAVPAPEKPSGKGGATKAKAERKGTLTASITKDNESTSTAAPRKPYTLNDLFNDAAKLPETEEALTELLTSSISATSKLLQQLLESSEVDLSSALFNAPPLTSHKLPSDPRRGADYLDANGYTMNSPFGEIYLSSHDRKQLVQGKDVRVSDPSKPQNVLKRAMITPNGSIFRHLSPEDEERVIAIQKRLRENEEKYGITGKGESKPLDAMDFMNLTGGLQELMSSPLHHRVSLLTAEPGADGTEDEDGDLGGGNASDETEEDEMAPLTSGFGAAPDGPLKKLMAPTSMKRKAEVPLAINLRNLDVDKLQKRIRETQVEMESARKEMEALEKKAVRKAKDVARWREALLKELGRGGGHV